MHKAVFVDFSIVKGNAAKSYFIYIKRADSINDVEVIKYLFLNVSNG